jgi:hypothetical protein
VLGRGPAQFCAFRGGLIWAGMLIVGEDSVRCKLLNRPPWNRNQSAKVFCFSFSKKKYFFLTLPA